MSLASYILLAFWLLSFAIGMYFETKAKDSGDIPTMAISVGAYAVSLGLGIALAISVFLV